MDKNTEIIGWSYIRRFNIFIEIGTLLLLYTISILIYNKVSMGLVVSGVWITLMYKQKAITKKNH